MDDESAMSNIALSKEHFSAALVLMGEALRNSHLWCVPNSPATVEQTAASLNRMGCRQFFGFRTIPGAHRSGWAFLCLEPYCHGENGCRADHTEDAGAVLGALVRLTEILDGHDLILTNSFYQRCKQRAAVPTN